MNDLSATIVPKSDQLNADDLIAGPITITVSRVEVKPGDEQPASIHYEGGRPYKPCKSMRRVLVQAWGPDAAVYAGRSMTLYRDPSVKWGGEEVGGIRIGAMSHIERDFSMALTATRGTRKPHRVKRLDVAASAPKRTVGAFLDELAATLDAATTAEAVDAIVAGAEVTKALGALQGASLDRLNAMVAAAIARVADDGFPGDRT